MTSLDASTTNGMRSTVANDNDNKSDSNNDIIGSDNNDTNTRSIQLSYQGKSTIISNVNSSTLVSGSDLHMLVYNTLQLVSTDYTLKLLYKGKRIDNTDENSDISTILFGDASNKKASSSINSISKILVMATQNTNIQEINIKKQDPTIRGFHQELDKSKSIDRIWGPINTVVSPFVNVKNNKKDYKFVRVKECTEHEFGYSKSNDPIPHSFQARSLLEKIISDPGIISVLQSNKLVVNTLGEMDPIDDQLMKKFEASHGSSCLLGYNTNHGLRIDIKLRTNDITTFRPYFELISTIIHELTHNTVSDHSLLFWIHYSCMRIEYLLVHKYLSSTLYNGQTSSRIAEIPSSILTTNESIFNYITQVELVNDMKQYQLHPQMILLPIRTKFNQSVTQLSSKVSVTTNNNNTTGISAASTSTSNSGTVERQNLDKRTLALQAAEQRQIQQQQQQQQQQDQKSNDKQKDVQ